MLCLKCDFYSLLLLVSSQYHRQFEAILKITGQSDTPELPIGILMVSSSLRARPALLGSRVS